MNRSFRLKYAWNVIQYLHFNFKLSGLFAWKCVHSTFSIPGCISMSRAAWVELQAVNTQYLDPWVVPWLALLLAEYIIFQKGGHFMAECSWPLIQAFQGQVNFNWLAHINRVFSAPSCSRMKGNSNGKIYMYTLKYMLYVAQKEMLCCKSRGLILNFWFSTWLVIYYSML